ncbi:MAG: hypothetical protein ACRDHN_13510 [Thermomicrobiales bacterium]
MAGMIHGSRRSLAQRCAVLRSLLILSVMVLYGLIGHVGMASADGTGTVYVHLHPCHESTTTTYWQDYASLKSTCTDKAVYFNFSLTTEGNSYNGQEETAMSRTYENVPQHIFTLEGQVVPYDGEPIVYCQNGNGGTDGFYSRMEVGKGNSWAIHPTMGPSGYVVCDWFAGVSDPYNEGTASIAIRQHDCPQGTDLSSFDSNSLKTTCAAFTSPMSVTIASGTNYGVAQTTGSQVAAGAYWQYIAPDFMQITSDLNGTSRVFCKGELPGGNYFAMAEIPAQGNTFAYNLMDKEKLTCDWYVSTTMADQNATTNQDNTDIQSEENNVSVDATEVPTEESFAGTGAIQLSVYTCPSGFDPAASDLGDLWSTCSLGGNGYSFSIYANGESIGQYSGDYVDQAVIWSDLTAGDVVVQESISDGFGTPFFVCDGWNGVSYDGSIQLTIADGATTRCDWFNTQP